MKRDARPRPHPVGLGHLVVEPHRPASLEASGRQSGVGVVAERNVDHMGGSGARNLGRYSDVFKSCTR